MERLTRRIGESIDFVDGKGYAQMSHEQGVELLFKTVDAYESSGLTPADITAMQAECKRLTDTNKALESDLYNANMNLEHIKAELTALKGQIERGEMVSVVRCGNCNHAAKAYSEGPHLRCANHNSPCMGKVLSMYDFCSWGESARAALKP